MQIGFYLYLLFIASWFLRFTVRFPILAHIRFDFLLILLIVFLHIFGTKIHTGHISKNICYRRLLLLIVAIFFSIPFSEWPGSVLSTGIQNYIKAIVFFFFTVWFVQTRKQLQIFIVVFLFCQTFRILEPLYLHLTQGYWGSLASMANWEFMYRLAGSPYDIINPNGLAFVVLTVLPFFLFYCKNNLTWKLVSACCVPASLYALYLTGSRSGMVGLIVVFVTFIAQSKHKATLFVMLMVLVTVAATFSTGNFRDRYLSIVSSTSKNSATAAGRIEGVLLNLDVGFRRPVFGHGLGTSLEANANFGHTAQPAHNLYVEIFQELGVVGLMFFVSYMVSIYKNLVSFSRKDDLLLLLTKKSLLTFFCTNVIFSFASYGLSGYEWYFLGGMSLLLARFDTQTGERIDVYSLSKFSSPRMPLAP